MTQGYSNVKFVGGVLDGQKFMDQPSIFLRALHKEFSGLWTGETSDGKLALFKSNRPGDRWHQLHQDIYQKGDKDSNGFIVYTFINTDLIYRCMSKTKKGTRCQHIANDNGNYCTVHERLLAIRDIE